MAEKDTSERPNALLTKKDREWLTADEPVYTGTSAAQQRYRRRSSIRDRVVASLWDLSLLFRELEESEREKIAEELEMRGEERVMGGPRPPSISVTDAIGFLYLLHDGDEQFEMSLRRGLSDALEKNDSSLFSKVSVDVDLTEWSRDDIQALKQKVEQGDTKTLSREEQDFLIDRLDTEELTAALERQTNPPSTHPGDRDSFRWP